MKIIIDDLNIDQHDQIADLFVLAGICITPLEPRQCSVFTTPPKLLYSIEISPNKANASALEGILIYAITYIGGINE